MIELLTLFANQKVQFVFLSKTSWIQHGWVFGFNHLNPPLHISHTLDIQMIVQFWTGFPVPHTPHVHFKAHHHLLSSLQTMQILSFYHQGFILSKCNTNSKMHALLWVCYTRKTKWLKSTGEVFQLVLMKTFSYGRSHYYIIKIFILLRAPLYKISSMFLNPLSPKNRKTSIKIRHICSKWKFSGPMI